MGRQFKMNRQSIVSTLLQRVGRQQILWAIFFVLFLLLCAYIAFGAQMCRVDSKIENAQAHFTTETNGVVYFKIESNIPDRVIGFRTEIAERAQLHAWGKSGDQNVMFPLEEMELDAGDWLILEPGGLHVMLFGVKEVPKIGDTFILTVEWERQGDKDIKVSVVSPSSVHDSHEEEDSR
jgi:copper(I)-binding protein